MKWFGKIALCVALSFMCIFTCIGYAGFTSDLRVAGTATADPPKAMFITSISNVKTSNVRVTTSPYNLGWPSTKFVSEITFGGRNAYISFDVSIKNGTDIDQYFNVLKEYAELEGVEGSFSSTNVKWTVLSVETGQDAQGTIIRSGEEVDFNVTLKLNVNESNAVRKMLYDFEFVLDSEDLTKTVSHAVTDKFAEILNGNLANKVEYEFEGTTYTVQPEEAYDKIVEKMETSSPSGNYIGNLTGADADDKALLTALFEGALLFDTGDDQVPITIMIKEKEIYNGGDKELVLYITGDTLSKSRAMVPVYAAVFTKASDGAWEQVGDILEGEARVIAYDGFESILGIGTGSFNTESWISTREHYNVAIGNEIDALMDGYEAMNTQN